MSNDLDADVIIVGAGMAGATLALALRQGGLSCVLIDPQTFEAQTAPTFDGRASAIAFSSFRQWRAIGAADGIEPHAQPINQILVTDGRTPGAAASPGHSAFLRFDAEEIAADSGGEPLGYMVENRHTRASLAAAVLAAGIRVIAPMRVEGVEVDDGRASVRLADGSRLSAALVVGADGRESLVRREAGIDVVGWRYGQSGVVATVAFDRPHEGVAYEYFLPSGPFAILPLKDNRASLVWTESADRGEALKAARPEVFDLHLKRRLGEFLGGLTLEGPRFVYPLGMQLAEEMFAPRIALMGDAAHVIHPIAGQGLNLGLKDAAALAEVLVEAARLGEDIGAEATLERYARWRRTDNVALTLATDAFVRLFGTDAAPVRAVRDLGMAAVNRLAPARKFFMKHAGGAVGDLPRLLRGETL